MNAAALLSRLEKAGVHIAAEDGQLKLDGPKAALGEEVLNELRQAKPELLKLLSQPERPIIAEWRAAIERAQPATPAGHKLKETSLLFLDSEDATAAIQNGWNDVSFFGLHKGSAPKQRIDAWGLVLFLAWGIHECRVESVNEKVSALRTRAGVAQHQPRDRANFDQAVPWWEHPALGDAL
jgi:hypothetical protein